MKGCLFRAVAVQLLPLLLLQVAAAVVKEEIHVFWQSPLDDASAVVKEVGKLLRVKDLEFFLLCQLVGGLLKERHHTIKDSYSSMLLLCTYAQYFYVCTIARCDIPSSSTFWSGISVWGSPNGGAGAISSSSSSSVDQNVDCVKHESWHLHTPGYPCCQKCEDTSLQDDVDRTHYSHVPDLPFHYSLY